MRGHAEKVSQRQMQEKARGRAEAGTGAEVRHHLGKVGSSAVPREPYRKSNNNNNNHSVEDVAMRRCEVDISRLEEEEGSSSADEEIITTLVVPSATEECDHCYLSKQKDIFRQVLKFLGEDTCRQGIVKTPARYAKAMAQMLSGYGKTAESILGDAIFNEECLYGKRQSVCVGNIEFYSTDINTLLPFFGEVHICYLPAHGNVAGLSKFARIVEAFSKRLQTPQTLAKNIACSIEDLLRPQGLFVVVQSMHLTHETVGWLGEAGRRSDFTDVYVEAKGAFLSNTSSSPPFSEEALEMLALMDISMEVNRKPDLGLETSQAAGIEMSGSGNGSLAVASTSGKRHYSVENCFAGGLNEFLGTKREFFTEKENSIKNLIYQIYDKSSDLNRSSTNVSRDVLWNAASRYANWLLQMTSGSYYAMDYVLQLVRTNPQIHQSVHRSAGNDRAFATYRRERLHFCELFTSVGSICEHHILPFFGKIYISLVKDESQVNVSMEELEAILWKYSRQLQLQERLATQVADALEKFFPHLDGVFVCMSAYHHCMRARGAEKTSAKTLSVIKRGIYEDDQALSMECIKRFHGMNCEKSVLTCQRC